MARRTTAPTGWNCKPVLPSSEGTNPRRPWHCHQPWQHRQRGGRAVELASPMTAPMKLEDSCENNRAGDALSMLLMPVGERAHQLRVDHMSPHFTALDMSLPEVATLVAAMMRARDAVSRRSWSHPQEPTGEEWWAD